MAMTAIAIIIVVIVAVTATVTPGRQIALVAGSTRDCRATLAPAPAGLRSPSPHLRAAVCPGMPYDNDRRFRGVVDAWREDNLGIGQIKEWIVTTLAKFGIAPGDLPPDVSY